MKDGHEPAILRDFLIAGTPLRGLVVQGPFSLCAYLGVPLEHWLAQVDELQFDCHWGVTFAGEGDGQIRPAGWYWYGWDYAHAGDAMDFPEAVRALLPEGLRQPRGKRWTVDEVEHEVIDAAQSLHAQLVQVIEAATASLPVPKEEGPAR